MRRIIRKLTSSLAIVFALIVSAVLWLWFDDPLISVSRCTVVVPQVGETLYFRNVAWGFGGGHWHVVLSRSRGLGTGRAYDPDSEYLFREPDGLLYRVIGKTVEVHAHWFSGPTPQRFNSKAAVTITTYNSNPEWLGVFNKRAQLGLTDVTECANAQHKA